MVVLMTSGTKKEIWEQTAEECRNSFISNGRDLSQVLATLITHLLIEPGYPQIVEGEALLPQTVVPSRFSELKEFYGLSPANDIRSVFLYEPEEQVLLQNVLKGIQTQTLKDFLPDEQILIVKMLESGQALDFSREKQRLIAHASWLYGQWLRQEAQAYHLPVIPSRPWDTLVERILDVVG